MSQPVNIADAIETRRRSRSKTPLINLRVSSDRENGSESPASRKAVRKAPTVGMIEESEEASGQKIQAAVATATAAGAGQTRGSASVRKTRVVTSDYSSDDLSPDRIRQAAAAVVANAANIQLEIQANLQHSRALLAQSAITTTSTMTSSSYETKTILVEGGGTGRQELASKLIEKTTTASGGRSPAAAKESVAAGGKLTTAATTAPKKGITTSSPTKPASARSQQEEKRTMSSTSTITTTNVSSVVGGIMHTSTPKNSALAAKSASSAKVILTPEELQQHAAYKEYLEAGEYWNKFPKTDYTYSELSPHRREVAPGLVAMPNMSRPSLNKHAERVQTMIERNPTQEAFIRQRYAASSAAARGFFAKSADPYDSTEEVDNFLDRAAAERHRRHATIEQQSIVRRFFLSIVTFFFTNFHTARTVFQRRNERDQYYTRIEDERGFFARAYGFVSSLFINVFKRVYLLISTVLFFDAFLLQTAAKNAGEQQAGQRKRRFLLFLLLLLPFLVIGAYLLADGEETIVFPVSSRATLALSSLQRIVPANVRDDVTSLYHRYVADSNVRWRSNLESFRSSWSLVPSIGWLTTLFSWPSWSWASSWRWSQSGDSTHESLRSTLKGTLGTDEYDALMRHIDAYIDGVMEQKYATRVEEERLRSTQEQQQHRVDVLAPEITVHVAQTIERSLKSYNYQLTDADVDRVAESVRLSLQATYPQLFVARKDETPITATAGDAEKIVLTKTEYLSEVQRLIEEHQRITIHNNHQYQYVMDGAQLEELLGRILSSERLLTLIDARATASGERLVKEFHAEAAIVEQQQQQQQLRDALVDDLRRELNDIKTHFSEQLLSSSVEWEARLQTLKHDQAQLGEQLRGYRLEQDVLYQKLLVDIDGRLEGLRKERFDGVNLAVREHIITILGLNVKQDITDGDLRAWISGLFVARDDLERRLEELQAKVGEDVREEIERTAGRLMREIGEKMREEMVLRLEDQVVSSSESTTHREAGTTSSGDGGAGSPPTALTEEDVRRIVRDALTVYDADKTGMVDYALESAGGQVLSTRCTESYQANSAEFRIFGIPIWYPSNTPRTVISPTMEPGQCWAFQGFPGYLVIQLNTEIIVTGFTLEHISKLLVPNGTISSAPKHFTVWGLTALNDPDPILLGSYEYQDRLGSSVQYFPVQNQDWRNPLQIVELRIETNHGNVRYTCLYRFRVHGDRA